MAKKIEAVQGDANLPVDFTLTDASNADAPVDLSASTVKLYYREVGNTTLIATVNCTLPGGGTDGKVAAVLPAACFATPGLFEGELEITTGSQIQTVRKKQFFDVREQIG